MDAFVGVDRMRQWGKRGGVGFWWWRLGWVLLSIIVRNLLCVWRFVWCVVAPSGRGTQWFGDDRQACGGCFYLGGTRGEGLYLPELSLGTFGNGMVRRGKREKKIKMVGDLLRGNWRNKRMWGRF